MPSEENYNPSIDRYIMTFSVRPIEMLHSMWREIVLYVTMVDCIFQITKLRLNYEITHKFPRITAQISKARRTQLTQSNLSPGAHERMEGFSS